MSDGDVWTGIAAQPDVSGQQAPRFQLKIERHPTTQPAALENVPPWDRPWVDPDAGDVLFQKQITSPRRHTYLLVDAGLRAKTAGFFDLDEVDVPCRCLFKGKAAQDLKNVAPYLIDLTLPEGAWDDAGLVPQFHKNFFAKHWSTETGILIQSTATLDEVWAHFRKFTKVMMPDKKVAYFRFWDPRMLIHFLQACTPAELEHFFLHPDDALFSVTFSELFQSISLRSARLEAI
ncbi:hypothetical protein ASD8599_03934 [Ascidiaceihabitans donghaensis]|uniref:DUF4123 domain-containing protein n=1 Tax=Ascidiaceihabitans donghaensis TaxID=1510460 RepID=A0A2R8BPD4_9RHOB|nr:DUF4123 domain-containing protein [Ascidiaceihabitans donghaensis]SPH27468.1 hypothetical protein ASD8599_03934 [Ascidiaceihabitans donghaensis]